MNLQIRTQSLSIAGRQIELVLPADPEQVLHDALAAEAADTSGCDPYWGSLWPAALKTAELILQQNWPARMTALELGCGVGLAGVAALLAGHEVTFADHAADAVQIAQSNAVRNGFSEIPALVFEWRDPPDRQFDFLFASDVLYESASHGPLLSTLRKMLRPGGIVWIGDPGRPGARQFAEHARRENWLVEARDGDNQLLAEAKPLQFHLIVMTL